VNLELMRSFLATEPVDRAQAAADLTRARQGTNEQAIGEVFRRVPRHAWSKSIAGLGAADARELLDRVHAPTLILHDPNNAYIPVAAAHYLHERIDGSDLEITEEAGQPLFGERLYQRVQEFIQRARAGHTA